MYKDSKKKKKYPEDQEVQDLDILDKYNPFIPDLGHENIDIVISLLNDIGVYAINNNFLAIFRYFHNTKYR